MDKIESIYRKYNRPAAQMLLQLAKSEGLQITSNEVKEFLAGRVEEQQLIETKSRKLNNGHIISLNPFNKLRLDIFYCKNMRDLTKDMPIYYASWIYSAGKHGVIL